MIRRLAIIMAFTAVLRASNSVEAAILFSDNFENEPITSFTTALPTMTSPDIGGSWSAAQLTATTSFVAANPESEPSKNMSTAVLSSYRFGSAAPIDPPAGATGIKTMVAIMSEDATSQIAGNGNAKIKFKIYDPSTASEPGFTTGLSLIVNNHPFNATGAPITNPQLLGAKFSATGLSFRDGNIREEPTATILTTYSLSDWHDVTIDLDYIAQTFTFNIDGIFTSLPINFVHQTPEDKSLTNIWFGHYGAGSHFYIDDLSVSSVPEPLSLIPLGVCLVVTGAYARSSRRNRNLVVL